MELVVRLYEIMDRFELGGNYNSNIITNTTFSYPKD